MSWQFGDAQAVGDVGVAIALLGDDHCYGELTAHWARASAPADDVGSSTERRAAWNLNWTETKTRWSRTQNCIFDDEEDAPLENAAAVLERAKAPPTALAGVAIT